MVGRDIVRQGKGKGDVGRDRAIREGTDRVGKGHSETEKDREG